jgi:hypothetical protein
MYQFLYNDNKEAIVIKAKKIWNSMQHLSCHKIWWRKGLQDDQNDLLAKVTFWYVCSIPNWGGKRRTQSVFLNHRVCKVNFNFKKEKIAYLPMQRQRRNWTIGETESRS